MDRKIKPSSIQFDWNVSEPLLTHIHTDSLAKRGKRGGGGWGGGGGCGGYQFDWYEAARKHGIEGLLQLIEGLLGSRATWAASAAMRTGFIFSVSHARLAIRKYSHRHHLPIVKSWIKSGKRQRERERERERGRGRKREMFCIKLV